MATQPINYAALADKARQTAPVDYAALAEKARQATAQPTAKETPKEPERKGIMRGVGDLWDSVKGIASLFHPEPQDEFEKGYMDSLGNVPGSVPLPLIRALRGYYKGTKQTIKQAEAAADKGDNAGVLLNSAAAGIPIVGQMVSGVYEQSGKGDVVGDVSLAASRIGQTASMAPEGSVIPNPAAGIAKVGTAAINKAGTAAGKYAPKLYQSALKPSTTMDAAAKARAIQTGLDEKIPVSEGGFDKIHQGIQDLNSKIDDVIAANPNAPINKFAVARRLNSTAKKFSNQVSPSGDLNSIANTGNDFLDTQPSNIKAVDAQDLKKGTYEQIGSRNYGEVKNAQIEAEKSLARGLKEELENQFPEIKGLNARESKFYGLEPLIARAVGRISNHEVFGIGTPIIAGGGAVLTGSSKAGAAMGLLKAVIDNPTFKSRMAIAMHQASKGTIGLKAAHARIAAYSDALAKAQESQPDGNEEQ